MRKQMNLVSTPEKKNILLKIDANVDQSQFRNIENCMLFDLFAWFMFKIFLI